MNVQDIDQVAVIGAGTMGVGIVQVFASAGFSVLLHDIDQEVLRKARSKLNTSLEKAHENGRIQEDPEEVLGRISQTTDLQNVSRFPFAVEAVIEKEGVKRDLFEKLDRHLADEAKIVSNTSSISITELASETSRAGQVAGMHFFNPVPKMKLVEVVNGVETSESTTELVVSIAEELRKTPVVVNDYPGFVSNRILCPMINEAIFALMEGVAGKEEIDEIMKLGMGHPMGPLELADMVGLDVLLDVLEVLHSDLGEDKYRPCPLLRKKVEAGHLGRKSGRGFYSYDE